MTALEPLFPKEALVEITEIDSAPVNVTTDVDNFEEGGFEQEIETKVYFKDAKVNIEQSQADGEITVNAKLARTIWDEMLFGNTGSDILSGGTRKDYRIVFLVTKDPAYTTFDEATTIASGTIGAYDTVRRIYAGCKMTSWNPALEVDGLLEGEATFQVSPTDSAADPNIRIQIGSTGYPALGSYATGTKW